MKSWRFWSTVKSEELAGLNAIARAVSLTPDELKELHENYIHYGDVLSILMEEIRKHNHTTRELHRLSGESASINFETYEAYSALHTMAIRISALVAGLKMSGNTLPKDLSDEISDLLDRYLLIEPR